MVVILAVVSNHGESQKKDIRPEQGGQKQEPQVSRSPIDTERFTDNGDQTVTDKKTGLIWQKGEVFDVSLEQATQAPDGLSIGGFNDWRMPTMLELLSIVDTSLNKPPFNDILGLTETEYFWSSESTPGVTDKAWVLNAGGGTGDKPINESRAAGGEKIYSLKCVRGNWEVKSPRFVDNGDKTVSDYLLKLVWQQSNKSGLSLSEAKSYIDKLNENGSYSWRLPTMPELAMLCDRSLSSPAVDQEYFSSISSDKYWTSSALSSGGRQWYVDLSNGMTTYDAPEVKHAVIAVRTMEEGS
ncbi:MAG: DUF1566 domain-containing protein [Eubacteriales bacterium]